MQGDSVKGGQGVPTFAFNNPPAGDVFWHCKAIVEELGSMPKCEWKDVANCRAECVEVCRHPGIYW